MTDGTNRWFVTATYGCGTWRREFTSLLAAWLWAHGMTAHGYEVTDPAPVPVPQSIAARHLEVVR